MVVLATAFVAFLVAASTASARMMRKDSEDIRARQAEAAKRWQRSRGPNFHPTNLGRSGVQNITFTNPKASGEFRIAAVALGRNV